MDNEASIFQHCRPIPPICVSHRKADELEFLAPRLLAMASALNLDLTLKLFCTGTTRGSSSSSSSSSRRELRPQQQQQQPPLICQPSQ